MKDKKDNRKSYWGPLGMCIGLSIGTAIGAATHNIGLWMPIGFTVGMCLGVLLDRDNKENENGNETGKGDHHKSTNEE